MKPIAFYNVLYDSTTGWCRPKYLQLRPNDFGRKNLCSITKGVFRDKAAEAGVEQAPNDVGSITVTGGPTRRRNMVGT